MPKKAILPYKKSVSTYMQLSENDTVVKIYDQYHLHPFPGGLGSKYGNVFYANKTINMPYLTKLWTSINKCSNTIFYFIRQINSHITRWLFTTYHSNIFYRTFVNYIKA